MYHESKMREWQNRDTVGMHRRKGRHAAKSLPGGAQQRTAQAKMGVLSKTLEQHSEAD